MSTEQPTLAEMEARRDELEHSIAVLEAKLAAVRAHRIQTGEYADPDWYRRAITRLRFTRLDLQQLNRKIAAVKREQRQAHAAALERAFVQAARELLTGQTFDAIMTKAQASVGA